MISLAAILRHFDDNRHSIVEGAPAQNNAIDGPFPLHWQYCLDIDRSTTIFSFENDSEATNSFTINARSNTPTTSSTIAAVGQ